MQSEFAHYEQKGSTIKYSRKSSQLQHELANILTPNESKEAPNGNKSELLFYRVGVKTQDGPQIISRVTSSPRDDTNFAGFELSRNREIGQARIFDKFTANFNSVERTKSTKKFSGGFQDPRFSNLAGCNSTHLANPVLGGKYNTVVNSQVTYLQSGMPSYQVTPKDLFRNL